LLLLGLTLLAGCTDPPADPGNGNGPGPLPPGPVSLALETVIPAGLQEPLGMEVANDGSGRLFLVEKGGTIRIHQDGTLQPGAFLDVSSLIRTEGERGLLGLAFHPEYASNGRLYVHYSGRESGDAVLAGYTVSADPDRVDPASARVLLTVDRREGDTVHNGGQIAFGPDGYLYLALGEGPPGDNSQRLDTLLGKILRIDVDGSGAGPAGGYAIPPGNPFAGRADALPEIWAYGLRNPWRFSFDRETGDLWIADVGDRSWEEVNVQPAGSGGQNYGWPLMEGRHCAGGATGCDQAGLTLPRIEYPHQGSGCTGSVTGGFVYRGSAFPELAGHYVFADFCRFIIMTAPVTADARLQPGIAAETGEFMSTSFGEDEAGELYMVGYGLENDGTLHRLVVR
jgi:glucose/arabinose dehydrogenase